MYYTGTDKTRSLAHRKFKYIYKEYKNGYWRYYYDLGSDGRTKKIADEDIVTNTDPDSTIYHEPTLEEKKRVAKLVSQGVKVDFEDRKGALREKDSTGMYKNLAVHFVKCLTDEEYLRHVQKYIRDTQEAEKRSRETRDRLRKAEKERTKVKKHQERVEKHSKEWDKKMEDFTKTEEYRRIVAKVLPEEHAKSKKVGKYKTAALPR